MSQQLQSTQTSSSQPSMGTVFTRTNEFNPEMCWFCKTTKAPKVDKHVRVEMYRRGKLISKEKDKKGAEVEKYAWDTVKFPIPRCEGCERFHVVRPMMIAGPMTLVLVGIAIAISVQWKLYDVVNEWPVFAETLCYGLIASIIASSISRQAVKSFEKKVPGELYARFYPVLDKLTSEGWVIGKCPTGDATGMAVKQADKK